MTVPVEAAVGPRNSSGGEADQGDDPESIGNGEDDDADIGFLPCRN